MILFSQENVVQQSMIPVPAENTSASNELALALYLAIGMQVVRAKDTDRHVGCFVSSNNELFVRMDFSAGRHAHLSYVCGVSVPSTMNMTVDRFIELGVTLFDPATSVTRALKLFSPIQIRTMTFAPFKYHQAETIRRCFGWNETKLNFLSTGLEVCPSALSF